MTYVQKVVIGDATLYQGEVLLVLPLMPVADLVIADPPYGIGESGRKNSSRGKLAKPRDYGDYSWDDKTPDPEEMAATLAAGKNCIVWGANHIGMPPASKWLCWDKLNSGDFADCELAWTNLPGAVRIFRHMWNGMLRDSERDPGNFAKAVKRIEQAHAQGQLFAPAPAKQEQSTLGLETS